MFITITSYHFRLLFVTILLLLSTASYAIQAPDFKLKGDTTEISLKQYRNKVVYVDFWASWCTPCKQSFPWMNQMQSRYKDQGFEIIAINLDDKRENAINFLKEVEAKFTIAYDPEGSAAQKYDLKVMPSSYLINRKGGLEHVHKGFKSADRQLMEDKIKSLVGKK